MRGRRGQPTPVHPRACGERASASLTNSIVNGSSPRLRGTLARRRESSVDDRFIPAPAGNALTWCKPPSGIAVHPRACGERTERPYFAKPRAGSSPRLRGTPLRVRPVRAARRFIPAPAGNAPHWPSAGSRQSVHPRACGERTLDPAAGALAYGSSPRLRGTPKCAPIPKRAGRFIPAPAGNAVEPGRVGLDLAVHPRACGERVSRGPEIRRECGSSPRLRGTLRLVSLETASRRFIPAPAGNAPNVTDCPTRRKSATKNLPSSFVKDQGVAAAGKRPI